MARGRALDNIFVERLWRNVKYEDIYLKVYGNLADLTVGLTAYFEFYNQGRPHQALGYLTPKEVYETGQGGWAMSLVKDKEVVISRETGQRLPSLRVRQK
jgi:putative transposase